MTFTFEWAITICVGIFLIGSAISLKTNFRIPTMLTVAILFLAGFWTIFPSRQKGLALWADWKQRKEP